MVLRDVNNCCSFVQKKSPKFAAVPFFYVMTAWLGHWLHWSWENYQMMPDAPLFWMGERLFRQKNVDDDWLWLRLNPIKLWIYTKKCGTNHQRFSPIFCYLRTFALIEDLFSRYLNTPRKTEPATEEEEWVLNHPDKYSTSRRRRGGGRYVYTRKAGRKGEK